MHMCGLHDIDRAERRLVRVLMLADVGSLDDIGGLGRCHSSCDSLVKSVKMHTAAVHIHTATSSVTDSIYEGEKNLFVMGKGVSCKISTSMQKRQTGKFKSEWRCFSSSFYYPVQFGSVMTLSSLPYIQSAL